MEKKRSKEFRKTAEDDFGKIACNAARCKYNFHIGEEIRVHHLSKLRKKLYKQIKSDGIELVHGIGKRKSKLQKLLETVEGWVQKLREYYKKIHICGNRGSYCKTDEEATFMRMKEDHILNGKLKPGYNVNVASVSEYIVGSYVSADRSDTLTTIPFMKQLQKSYEIHSAVYECADCKGCPMKEKCIRSKSKTPLEERSKRLEVSKYFSEQREAMEAKIATEEGKKLRMNRFIQAEGAFAYIKTDLKFRRFY